MKRNQMNGGDRGLGLFPVYLHSNVVEQAVKLTCQSCEDGHCCANVDVDSSPPALVVGWTGALWRWQVGPKWTRLATVESGDAVSVCSPYL